MLFNSLLSVFPHFCLCSTRAPAGKVAAVSHSLTASLTLSFTLSFALFSRFVVFMAAVAVPSPLPPPRRPRCAAASPDQPGTADPGMAAPQPAPRPAPRPRRRPRQTFKAAAPEPDMGFVEVVSARLDAAEHAGDDGDEPAAAPEPRAAPRRVRPPAKPSTLPTPRPKPTPRRVR